MMLRRSPLKRTALIATLLHYANASPPWNSQDFYSLKSRLLNRHARFCGHDLQEIRKKCWGYRDWDSDYQDYMGCAGATCKKCGGTGLIDIRWVRLQRWEFCGYVFHCPDGDTRVPPPIGTKLIIGRIEHANYGRASSEAVLWLYLLCGEWRLLWKELRSSRACGWTWWPLLNVQKVAMELSMMFRWQRCFCGRMYPTWGSGRQVCRRCWNRPVTYDEVPF